MSAIDQQLLEAYAREHSEGAFRQIVERYGQFVYSSAYRRLGDHQLAEDATQATFVILAEKAGKLRKTTMLGGWLWRTAGFVARNMQRRRAARAVREREAAAAAEPDENLAWQSLMPELDRALDALAGGTRQAVLSYYMLGKSQREVAAELGTTEEGARKRIKRGLMKLRELLTVRGVAVPTALLGSVLGTRTAEAVSVAFLDSVHEVAYGIGSGTVAAGGGAYLLARSAERVMLWAKVKVAAACAGLAVGVAGVSTAVAVHFLTPPPAPPAPPPPPAPAPARAASISPDGDWVAAINALQPGEIGQLEPGRFTGRGIITVRGTADQPITVCGAPGLASILDGGPGRPQRFYGALRMDDCVHLVLENVTVQNPSPQGLDGATDYTEADQTVGASGLLIRGGSHIAVRNCRFAHIAQRGILATHCTALSVERCLFVRVGNDSASGDIELGNCTAPVIRRNLLAGDVGGVFFHGQEAGGLVERNLLLNHKWERSISIGDIGRNAEGTPWTAITGNVIYADRSRERGIAVSNGVRYLRICGNVIYGGAASGFPVVRITGGAQDIEHIEVIGNWIEAEGGGPAVVIAPAAADELAALRDIAVCHNVIGGGGDTALRIANRTRTGVAPVSGIRVFNNIFDGARLRVDLPAGACTAGANLYHNVPVWPLDAAPITGAPVYRARPGPLAPGPGYATAIEKGWGRDVGIPRAMSDPAGLETAILADLAETFTATQIRECLLGSRVRYAGRK